MNTRAQWEPRPAALPEAKRAGAAIARYFPADPVLWLTKCADAGIYAHPGPNGRVALIYDRMLLADHEQASFLEGWLYATPNAVDAVNALLWKRRAEGR
jgi:hypothetical protein